MFSSRFASTWPTPMQGSSVFAAAMPSGDKPSPSSVVSTSRPRRKRRKIWSPPTSRPGVQSLHSPSPLSLLLALVLGVSWPLHRLSPWRRSCCAISPLRTGVRGNNSNGHHYGHHNGNNGQHCHNSEAKKDLSHITCFK
jgi:hypothetical protein